MAKARRLAKESGTTHVPVTVWNNQTDFGTSVGAYLADLLRQLGYRATVRNVPQDQFHAAVYNASHKIQLGLTGWAADIPTTSDFFLPILTCRSIYQDPAGTANLAGFCDPQVDQLASQAQAAQPTDPAGARKLWAKLDRTVTDQAPLVPVLNTSFTVFVSARVGNYQESPSYDRPAARPDLGPVARVTSPPGSAAMLSAWQILRGEQPPQRSDMSGSMETILTRPIRP